MRDPYLSFWVLLTALGCSCVPLVTAASLANGSSNNNVTSGSPVRTQSVTSSTNRGPGPQYAHSPYSVFIQLKSAQQSLPDNSSPEFQEFVTGITSEASKAYKEDHNLLRLDVFTVSPDNATIDLNVVFRISLLGIMKLRAVARLKQYIDSKDGRLGELVIHNVTYISDTGMLTATTEFTDVMCVSVGHHCFSFCDANPRYCTNGGTCQEDDSQKLLCTCIYEPFVHYTGARCDRRTIGIVSILIIALGLLVTLTCILYAIKRWKRTGSPVPRISTRGYSTRHLEGTKDVDDNKKCTVWTSESSGGSQNPVYEGPQGLATNGPDPITDSSAKRSKRGI
ncbi:Hypp1821 [Branchiostoma lanceolatum]|uniref:Hypp1821 protein n=1 Tax=Branchiostoma lanceolatum TaxID=7740 RepID=A0A8K0EME9_BRALA|nr:Hypp1821 [Branchiostoma lanceolatum]